MRIRAKVLSEFQRAAARAASVRMVARGAKVRADSREITQSEYALISEALEAMSDHLSVLGRSNNPLLRMLAGDIADALYCEAKRYAHVARYGLLSLPVRGGDES